MVLERVSRVSFNFVCLEYAALSEGDILSRPSCITSSCWLSQTWISMSRCEVASSSTLFVTLTVCLTCISMCGISYPQPDGWKFFDDSVVISFAHRVRQRKRHCTAKLRSAAAVAPEHTKARKGKSKVCRKGAGISFDRGRPGSQLMASLSSTLVFVSSVVNYFPSNVAKQLVIEHF